MALDAFHRQVSNRVLRLARERGWSLNQLADFAGIGRGHLSNILNTKQSPTLRTLKRLADALEARPKDLLPD